MLYPLPGEMDGVMEDGNDSVGVGVMGASMERDKAGEVGDETVAAAAAGPLAGVVTTMAGAGSGVEEEGDGMLATATGDSQSAAAGEAKAVAAAATVSALSAGVRPLDFSIEVQQMLALLAADPAAILTLADSTAVANAAAPTGGDDEVCLAPATSSSGSNPTSVNSSGASKMGTSSNAARGSTSSLGIDIAAASATGGGRTEAEAVQSRPITEPLIQGLGVDRRAILQYMQGDVAGFLQTAVAAGAVDGEVVGLAVAGGEQLWRAAGRLYAARCTAEGRLQEGAVQLLAMGDVEGAAEIYRWVGDGIALAEGMVQGYIQARTCEVFPQVGHGNDRKMR
jgi:SWI/SNF-related matrix-associated actin-dependent regulator 1 of chromatin subfamily A